MTDQFETGREAAPDLNDLFGELFNSSQFANEDAQLPERNCSIKEQDGVFRIGSIAQYMGVAIAGA